MYTLFFAQNEDTEKNVFEKYVTFAKGDYNGGAKNFWKVVITDVQFKYFKSKIENKDCFLNMPKLPKGYFKKDRKTKTEKWIEKGKAIFNSTSDFVIYKDKVL